MAYQVRDRSGKIIWLADDEPCPDGCALVMDVQFMDSRVGAAVAPPGKYFLYDKCGRVAGLGDVALATKAQQAKEDYKQRLSDASKKLPVARDVAARQWYSTWLVAHGNM